MSHRRPRQVRDWADSFKFSSLWCRETCCRLDKYFDFSSHFADKVPEELFPRCLSSAIEPTLMSAVCRRFPSRMACHWARYGHYHIFATSTVAIDKGSAHCPILSCCTNARPLILPLNRKAPELSLSRWLTNPLSTVYSRRQRGQW